MSATREQEFQEVRRLLGNPIEQRPNADLIVSGMIRQEQMMMNRLNGSSKAWTQESTQIVTVANTGDYTVTPAGTATFGKALFVYRDLGDNTLLPIPFTDYSSELNNQTHDFFNIPIEAGMFPNYSSVKAAFYRSGGSPMMRIYPVPEESSVIYKIVYATGRLDWTTFDWPDVPAMPEFSNLRTLSVALFLLPYAEWEGYSKSENSQRRSEIRQSLEPQMQMQDIEFAEYIRNPQHEPISDVGYWWEA